MSDSDPRALYYKLKEVNSIWRSVLHLGTKEIVKKSHTWARHQTDYLYFLDKGRIILKTINSQGQERLSLYVESGSLFFETGVFAFSRDSNYAGIFTALEECTVYAFSPQVVKDREFLKKYPDIAYNLIESLANKATIFYSLLADSSGPSALEIVCKYIERLALRYNSNVFAPNLAQGDMALNMGLHRSSFCRIIKELREENVLGEVRKDKLTILDRKRLQKYAKGISMHN